MVQLRQHSHNAHLHDLGPEPGTSRRLHRHRVGASRSVSVMVRTEHNNTFAKTLQDHVFKCHYGKLRELNANTMNRRDVIITFCVSHRRRKMYCGHAYLCLSATAIRPHYCTDPDVIWRCGRGCPLVVHYWAVLQSGHGLHCNGNITRTLVTSLCPSHDMTT